MNKIRVTFFAIMTLLTTVTISFGQATRSITLDEAVQLSLENSNQLKLSKYKIAQASAALKEAKENRLPNASISGSYLRLNEPNVDLKVKLGQQSTKEMPTTSTTPVVNQAAYVLANISVPVFSGFRIHYGIEAAKYLEQATRLDADKDRDELISNTIAAYSNLYKSKAALDLVHENLAQSKQRVKDFSNLETNGLLARNDLLKAQLQQSNVELTLLDAENNWKLSNISMALMLGFPEETELIPDSSSFLKINDEKGFSEWESLALNNRKDASALDYRKKANNANIKAIKGEYYPSFAVTGGYIAADILNLITITNAVNVGVGLSYTPSSLWKTGAKVSAAKAKMNELEVNQQILNDAIRLQVAHAYQTFLSSKKKIEVYKNATDQANENYRIVKNKYDNALATATDLLEADVAQLQSQLNYVFAKADAVVAYKNLVKTAGIIDNNSNN